MRAGLALVPEDRKSQGLFLGLPIRNNITLTILDRLVEYGIINRERESETVQRAKQELAAAQIAHGGDASAKPRLGLGHGAHQ